jgi:hypothetical protein
VFHSAVTAAAGLVSTVRGVSYASDLTAEHWALLEPVFNAPGKRGPKHAPDQLVLNAGHRAADQITSWWDVEDRQAIPAESMRLAQGSANQSWESQDLRS